jgi:multiple sugar transport system permease protein
MIAAMSIFPLLFSLGMTFTDMRLLDPEAHFIGLANWKRLLTDRNVRVVMKNTITMVLVGASIQYVIGFAMALLLNRKIRFRRFFRIAFLLPMMMAPVAVSYVIGKMIFSESFGPFNDMLMRIGLSPLRWSADPVKSMAILIAVDTWQHVPFFVLVLLAALQAISEELYDAARVDGATGWSLFRYITFPLMIPASTTTIIIRALNAFQVMAIIATVTGGGPGNSTESVTLFAYHVGIKGTDIAFGSTLAYALLIVVALFTVLFQSAARRVSPFR